MHDRNAVVIVDYGMGNLYSVQRACEAIGLNAVISASADHVLDAAGVILPGVGAMPEAMKTLEAAFLAPALRHVAEKGTPFFGICLGMQLLMTHGTEFGEHRGLGILEGRVERIAGVDANGRKLKVPHIGWSNVVMNEHAPADWPRDAFAYFVHSFSVVPVERNVIAATTTYGDLEICSALVSNNILACQFHPERSGAIGLKFFESFAQRVAAYRKARLLSA
jgi:imidazole glycerol-phosphate synthase subunit HisH